MLDTRLQERFTRGCTNAAFGYTAATTAAYAAWADQVFSFWADALKPPAREPAVPQAMWGWPLMSASRQAKSAPMADPFAGANAALAAWFSMFPYLAPSAAWPMAFTMMAQGVPRSVAWPTAEANVAAMDAADAAAVSVQKVFASYRSDSGHAVAPQSWSPVQYMMLAALVPLNINAMMTAFRLA